MKGVSPVSEVSPLTVQSPATSSTILMDPAVYWTVYFTMRPLTSLQGVRPFHSTEMTVELSAVALTLLGATAAPVQRE